jgi:hypothetical protein
MIEAKSPHCLSVRDGTELRANLMLEDLSCDIDLGGQKCNTKSSPIIPPRYTKRRQQSDLRFTKYIREAEFLENIYAMFRLFSWQQLAAAAGGGILIFELSFQSHVNNFYRANFYLDIGLGLA